ncbi:hypothetical protein IWQ60_007471, partial [Tieghemiomyces parasiticus]
MPTSPGPPVVPERTAAETSPSPRSDSALPDSRLLETRFQEDNALADALAGSLSVGPSAGPAHRKVSYKVTGVSTAPEVTARDRRSRFLMGQRKRRHDFLGLVRNLTSDRADAESTASEASDSDSPPAPSPARTPLEKRKASETSDVEEGADTPAGVPKKTRTQGGFGNGRRTRHRLKQQTRYRDQLMLPEPLDDIPDDLAEHWSLVPVPPSPVCLLIASQ